MSYSFNHQISLYKNLQQTFGIGESSIKTLFKQLGFSKNLLSNYLDSEQTDALNRQIKINNIKTDQELKKKLSKDLDRLVFIKSQKGLRKLKGYPVRGQRTHSNGNTAKKRKYF